MLTITRGWKRQRTDRLLEPLEGTRLCPQPDLKTLVFGPVGSYFRLLSSDIRPSKPIQYLTLMGQEKENHRKKTVQNYRSCWKDNVPDEKETQLRFIPGLHEQFSIRKSTDPCVRYRRKNILSSHRFLSLSF